MADYDNTNRFALFNNDKKEEERDADRTGSITVECPHCQAKTEFFMDGWLGKTREGNNYLSGRIKAKKKQQHDAPPSRQQRQESRRRTNDDDIDDDIPF